VIISSAPTLADIEIDGKYRGSTRSSLHLSAGTHLVTIKKVGYGVWTKTIEVTAGSELAVHAELVRTTKVPPSKH